jgi:lysozyme
MNPTFTFPDLSHWDRLTPDAFHQFKANNFPCVILKATQGNTNTDPTYTDYAHRTRTVGLLLGAYVFLTPGAAGPQIVHYESIAHLQPGDIQPIVDAEAAGLTKATTFAAMADLEAHGYKPILYASYAFWHDVLGAPTKWPLWLAAYRAVMPALPKAVTLFAWQYSESASCPGVVGNCDMNKFYAKDFSQFLIPKKG